jgi:hypothetical protein
MATHLLARPPCRPVGDPAVADHDPAVGLHPRPHRADLVRAPPERTCRHIVATGRPKLGRSTSRRRSVCLTLADLPQLEHNGRGVVEAMWT